MYFALRMLINGLILMVIAQFSELWINKLTDPFVGIMLIFVLFMYAIYNITKSIDYHLQSKKAEYSKNKNHK